MPPVDDDAFEPGLLSLSVSRVELRLYRRSKTSADNIQQPPHFQYVVRVDWRPATQDPEDSEGVGFGQRSGEEDGWWNELPRSYVVRRRWADIVRFHKVLDLELAYDQNLQCRRVKAPVPNLPAKGDLEAFVKGVAATGDACAMHRGDRRTPGLRPQLIETQEEKKAMPREVLDDMHYTYVRNRLGPYFDQVNRVLAEVPAELLADNRSVHHFVTAGQRHTLARADPTLVRQPFIGHQTPVLIDPDELQRAAREIRKSRPPSAKETAVAVATGTAAAKPRRRASGASPMGSGSPASPTSPSSPMGKSASAPSICSFREPRSRDEASEASWAQNERRDQREQRLAASHYGLFARALSGESFGYASRPDLWKRMVQKEKKELGRRTLLAPSTGDAGCWKDRDVERLPRLPPPGANDPYATLRPEEPGRRRRVDARLSVTSFSAGPSTLDLKLQRADVVRRDICEGLHITVLGEKPSQDYTKFRGTGSGVQEQSIEERPPGNQREVLRVYRRYCILLEMGASKPAPSSEESDSCDEVSSIAGSAIEDHMDVLELPPISWTTFLMWIERECDFASDFRKRSVINSLFRAVKHVRSLLMGPQRGSSGVHLTQLFQWIWPTVSHLDVAGMLTWICHQELEKIRQPTPETISSQERRGLDSLFNSMDTHGRGYLTAVEIAGGEEQGIEEKLKNVVDINTVRKVCGDGGVSRREFLELMCEEGYRAHDDARFVLLEDGRRLVEVTRPAVGYSGWFFEEPPSEELQQRHLVDTIEQEVLKWKRLAGQRRPAALMF